MSDLLWLRLVRYLYIHTVHMSPAFNKISALRRFKHGNPIKIQNGIMFDFYLVLPQLHTFAVVIPPLIVAYTKWNFCVWFHLV